MRAALVTPLTGPFGAYGRAGADALRLWAEGAVPGALPAGAGRVEVELAVHDAHRDLVAALRGAEAARPDVLFGPYGSGPTRAVAAGTSRLLFNHGGARPGGSAPRVDVLAPAESYLVGSLRVLTAAVSDLRSVAVVHADSGFGCAVAGGAAAEARRLGLNVTVVVMPAEPRAVVLPSADVLLVAGSFDQELAVARAAPPGTWRAAVFVGAGVEEVLAELGDGREGLLGPAQWLAEAAPARPDEGPTAAAFVAAFRERTGAEPSYPAVQAFAAGVLAERCLRDAGGPGASDAAVLAAARALDCTTLFGRFRLDPGTGEQTGHQVVTVQWQDGRRRAVWPLGPAAVPVRVRA